MSGFSFSGSGLSLIAPLITSTWANLPSASTVAPGQQAFVTNAGTKGSTWTSDGTRWKPLNGLATLTTLDSASGNIGNTATIVLQYLIPASMWQTGDVIRIQGLMEKSGTTDTGVSTMYIGTAGTTADTAILSSTWMSAANLTVDAFLDVRLDAATTAQIVSLNTGYGSTNSAQAASFTISSAVANNLYVSWAIRSGGTTNTVSSRYGAIYLKSKGT